MKNTLVIIALCIYIASVGHAQNLCDTLFNKDTIDNWAEDYSSYYRVYDASDKSKGRKPYRDYYKTGELSAKGYYLTIDEDSTVFDGEQIHYYKNGKIDSRIFFSDNMQHKKVTTFYQNGNKALEYEYENEPEEYEIFDVNKGPTGLKDIHYINIFDGLKAIYDTLGRMLVGGEFVNGKRNGRWILRNCFKIHYLEYLVFDFIDYFCNTGQPHFLGLFDYKTIIDQINDLKYEPDGYYLVHYSNGKLHGICKLYTNEGEDKGFTLNYRNGYLDGYQLFEGDSTILEDLFENGKFIKETLYDNKGNIKWILDCDDKSRKTVYLSETENPFISKISFHYETNIFFPCSPFGRIMNNAFWAEAFASDISKAGRYQMFDRYNRLFADGEYVKDKKSGDWIYYYYDQGIYEKRVYKDSIFINTRIYTLDDKPFTGTRKVVRQSESDDDFSTVEIKVKDAVIKEVRYLNTPSEKIYTIVKYQNGLPK